MVWKLWRAYITRPRGVCITLFHVDELNSNPQIDLLYSSLVLSCSESRTDQVVSVPEPVGRRSLFDFGVIVPPT